MNDADLIAILIAKSDAFAKSLGNPVPLRAKVRLGSRAYAVIVGPFPSPERAAEAVGCERIELDGALGAEDAEFEQIVDAGAGADNREGKS